MTTPNLTLACGFQLLKDVGEGDSDLITATLGSGQQTAFNSITPTNALETSTSDVLSLAATVPPTKPPVQPAKKDRRTALCKKHGPCEHHGPKSLHSTIECIDPQLLKRRNKNARLTNRQQQQQHNSQVNTICPYCNDTTSLLTSDDNDSVHVSATHVSTATCSIQCTCNKRLSYSSSPNINRHPMKNEELNPCFVIQVVGHDDDYDADSKHEDAQEQDPNDTDTLFSSSE